MRMLHWMCGKSRWNKIRNGYIRVKSNIYRKDGGNQA